MIDKERLLDALTLSPGDWSVRIELIEDAVRSGDLATAKRLVRASPDDVATPAEIQVRLHTLLTKGISPEEKPPVCEAVASDPRDPKRDLAVEARSESATIPEELEKPEEPKKPTKSVAKSESTDLSGGSGALVETEISLPEGRRSASRSSLRSSASKKTVSRVERQCARDKWKDYDGGLALVALERVELAERSAGAPERISAMSLALLAHLGLIVLLSLVAVQVSRIEPPQLVVSVVHEREAELTTTRLTRPTTEVKPSAAAAQAVDVISSVSASSTFSVPDVEDAADLIVSSTLPGVAAMGSGISFSTEAVKSSDINFFGLSGSGRKIVFVIDTTPEMLVDEKGGMSAYNKVKEEVGIMLANLNRGTHFNLLLYEGKELVAFRPELVPGLPSNLRQAIEWLDPLNRDYEALGLRGDFGAGLAVAEGEDLPIAAIDVAHYTKAVQKALEWQASAIFCISTGYRGMARAPTPEMLKKMAEMPAPDPGEIDPREQRAWQEAVAKTREWLAKENAARRERGLDPKVVTNFNQLVREITGASPPRRQGGNAGAAMPGMPAVTPEDIERQVDLLVKQRYKGEGIEEPSLHMVLFLGEDEEIADASEDHFKSLVRKNRGKLKILRGLAALKNVTGAD